MDAVTKRAVCARARLNDRYFYEHFADRDALLRVLAVDLTEQGLAASVAGTMAAGPDIRAQIRGGVGAAVGFVVADPRRIAILEASYHSDVLHRARVTAQHAIAKTMVMVRRDMMGESEVESDDTEMSAYALAAGALELVAAWSRSEFDATKENMVDLVARMLFATGPLSSLTTTRPRLFSLINDHDGDG